MKFNEMTYTRPDLQAICDATDAAAADLTAATSYAEAREIMMRVQEIQSRVMTQASLASVRHTIDTRDAFYDAEDRFWNENTPILTEHIQRWVLAMVKSPYRSDFEKEYGTIMFVNAELQLKAFSPEIIPEAQKENDLTTEYTNLIASAQIPFEGGTYTLSQMTLFKNDPDDARRLAAWKAEGQWYTDHREELDRIYDELVHLRDTMGKKMGYTDFRELGYYRMQRNCYTESDIERFREAVRTHLVPIADRIYRDQAARMGYNYPMSFAEAELEFASGNPKPQGTAEEILEAGQAFYDDLSPETSAFFRMMRERELLDVLSTEGKAGGGYCTAFQDYKVPFIFANFNGTQGDVEVITHEAGHAFAYYMNADRIPIDTIWAGMESSEVHSMAMEYFAWPQAERFFGPDADKYRYSHLAGSLKFIPYGTAVDHFQHLVYERPEMTPDERHAVWKELLGTYMPWLRLDGEIPFYSEGKGWQRQSHIYQNPFYYIDYCLAQTVALVFWKMIREDGANAWDHYMTYTKQGGSRPFTELLRNADLPSPFEEETLRGICETAAAFLDEA